MSWRTPPAPVPAGQITKTLEADVVVVGLGFAGTTAFRAAAEAGADVIAVEFMKQARYTAFGRDIGHLNSRFLEKRGVPKVDVIEFYNEWMRRAGNRANGELVMKFARHSGEAFDWFIDMIPQEVVDKNVHVAFWPKGSKRFKAEAREKGYGEINGYKFWNGTAQFPGIGPNSWSGAPTLPDLCRENQKKAEELGGRAFFGVEALQLAKENGRVTGVLGKERDSGGIVFYRARRGVILAAGDFSSNQEMVQDLVCDITDLYAPGEQPPRNPGRSGRGLQMGVWAGGRLETRPLPTQGGNTLQVFGGMVCWGSVWLDSSGRRFCNEVFGGMEFPGFAANQTVCTEVYRVFDRHARENELAWAPPAHGCFDANLPGAEEPLNALYAYADEHGSGCWENPFKDPFGPKKVWFGRTPEELVSAAGINGGAAQNIIDSIHRYNGFCAQGRDDDFGRDPKMLDPLTDILFLEIMPKTNYGGMLVTMGGLVTDGDQRVLDQNYHVIPGLYATGNCCGRRVGLQYSTPIAGVSIGLAITLGREAGRAAASAAD